MYTLCIELFIYIHVYTHNSVLYIVINTHYLAIYSIYTWHEHTLCEELVQAEIIPSGLMEQQQ